MRLMRSLNDATAAGGAAGGAAPGGGFLLGARAMMAAWCSALSLKKKR